MMSDHYKDSREFSIEYALTVPHLYIKYCVHLCKAWIIKVYKIIEDNAVTDPLLDAKKILTSSETAALHVSV